MSNAPSVDPARIESFYQELAGMQVELDADPLALGPKRINAKTAACRALLSRTERIFLEISQDLYWYKREHRMALADFELAVQELMSNDPEVRAGRNITDREAIAHTKLRADRERISVLQFACEDLDAVLSVVKVKRNDLKDIASRLRDQLKICQEEIGLGARWGLKKRLPRAEEAAQSSRSTDGVVALMDEILAKSDDEDEEASDEDDEDVLPAEIEGSQVPPTSVMDTIFDGIGTPGPLPEGQPTSETDAEIDAHLEGLNVPTQPSIEADPGIDMSLDEILDSF
jgi:hypothetical protein